MAPVHEYTHLENSIIHRMTSAIEAAGRGIVEGLQAFGRFLTRRYTVVLVPHSEKKVYNLQVTVLSVFLFLLVTGGIVSAFMWYSASYNSTQNLLAGKDSRLQDLQASLDQLRDEANVLLRDARGFENAFSSTMTAVNSEPGTQKIASGDFASIFNIRETPEGLLQEVDNIRRLSAYLSSITEPTRELGARLDSQSAILAEIPSVWPVKGGLGHISMYFGQNVNPFSGQYYIHKGIDISTYRSGDPVVATADGQVVTIDYTEDFGNYILVKHKHGYYTRYAHLLSAKARLGQKVQQGELIGYIGNTGLSTGPHLHYEIRIGSDVIDPYKYITMRTNTAKQDR